MENRNIEAVKKREDESALTEKDYMTMEIIKLKKEIETLRKEKDEVEQDVNRMIVRYLCAACDKETIDQMDQTDGSTALHVACEDLSDFQIVELIVNAGADLDPVRNDDKLPLAIVRERLEANPDNNDLYDIEEFLTRKGASTTWR